MSDYKKHRFEEAVKRGTDADIREAARDLQHDSFHTEENAEFMKKELEEHKRSQVRGYSNEAIYDGVSVTTGSFAKINVEEEPEPEPQRRPPPPEEEEDEDDDYCDECEVEEEEPERIYRCEKCQTVLPASSEVSYDNNVRKMQCPKCKHINIFTDDDPDDEPDLGDDPEDPYGRSL